MKFLWLRFRFALGYFDVAALPFGILRDVGIVGDDGDVGVDAPTKP